MRKRRSRNRTQAPPDAERREETGEETPGASAPTPEEPREDLLEQLQRLQAEFSNYRKRVERERIAWEDRAQGEILAGLLPILDDIDRARASIGPQPGGKDVEGLLLILGRLDDHLRMAGLDRQPIEPGTPFDPDHHDAVMTEPSEEHPEGAILGALQSGYLFRGTLLRPGRVRVSSGPREEEEAAERVEEESETREA